MIPGGHQHVAERSLRALLPLQCVPEYDYVYYVICSLFIYNFGCVIFMYCTIRISFYFLSLLILTRKFHIQPSHTVIEHQTKM